MQEYKKEIYELWGDYNPITFPYPDDRIIEEKSDLYRRFIIEKFLPKNKDVSILDIGCGYGLFLNACKEAGYKNIFGVEIIKKCIEFAIKKLGINSISKSEIINYLKTKEDASFDVITAFNVVEHFKREEILDLLKLIYRKLKNNGLFIMQVPNAGSLSGLYIFHSDLTHETPFTDSLIKQIFHLVGFNELKIVPNYRPRNLKNLFLNVIRRIVSIILFSNNEFIFFTTNIIAIGYKK